MLIEVVTTWTSQGNGGGGNMAHGTGLAFDTVTHQIVPFNQTRSLALLDPIPPNVTTPAGGLIWFECAVDYTETQWIFDGANGTTTTTIPNSTSCGWMPPPVPGPTCDLVLVVQVNGDTLVATVTQAHGAVTFSIDGGTTVQSSGTFGPLVAGTYTLTAYDAGSTNCSRSVTRTIVAAVPGLVPVASAMPQVGFSRNPLALLATATQPGRDLLVELWVESEHGSGLFERVVQRLRPTDSRGQAELQLQGQLHAVLTPERPTLVGPPRVMRLTQPIRRYYAAIAEVEPATGLPSVFVYQAPATVLRGGLPWALARAGTFFVPFPTDFLTWRPAGEQLVGRNHVVLLAALVPFAVPEATLRVQAYRRGASAPFQTLTDVLVLPALLPGQAASPHLVQLQARLDVLPTDAYRVEVQLVVNNQVQASRRYRLDDSYRHRQYIFLNSLGQWDTLSCRGPLTSKGSIERTVATRLVPADYDPADGSESVVDVALDSKLSVSTGSISPAEVEYLRELLLSRDVYEVSGRYRDELRKIRLLTKDFLDYQDDAGADGLAFEYTYCFDTSLFDNARLTHF
ncbi:MAG: Ig-like domain-containing protein [Janthinobacterium lividum]